VKGEQTISMRRLPDLEVGNIDHNDMRGSPDTAHDAGDGSSEDELGVSEGGDLADEVDDFLDKDEETDQEDT
jgi:hypothetical protein